MTNINKLEELRTKKELLDYFEQLGKSITEEEIDTLKQSYNQAQESNTVLTMQQLNDVAGGILFTVKKEEWGTIFRFDDDKQTTIKVKIIDNLRSTVTNLTYTDHFKFFHDFLAMDIVKLAHRDLIDHPGRYSAEFRETIMYLKAEIDKPDFHDSLLAYTLANPFHKGVEGLCIDHSSIVEIRPRLEFLQDIYHSSSPKIQRLIDVSAYCVKGIDYSDTKHNYFSGETSRDTSIKLNQVNGNIHDIYDLPHEMFHCLDYRLNCSEHLGNKIYNFIPNKFLYDFFTQSACSCLKGSISLWLNAKMAQVLALHRGREFDTDIRFYCMEDKLDDSIRSQEMFARLCEIYVYTNGTWIIPSPNTREAMIAKEGMTIVLTSFLTSISKFSPALEESRDKVISNQAMRILKKGFNVKAYFPGLVEAFEAEIESVQAKAKPFIDPASPATAEEPTEGAPTHPNKGKDKAKGKKKKGKK